MLADCGEESGRPIPVPWDTGAADPNPRGVEGSGGHRRSTSPLELARRTASEESQCIHLTRSSADRDFQLAWAMEKDPTRGGTASRSTSNAVHRSWAQREFSLSASCFPPPRRVVLIGKASNSPNYLVKFSRKDALNRSQGGAVEDQIAGENGPTLRAAGTPLELDHFGVMVRTPGHLLPMLGFVWLYHVFCYKFMCRDVAGWGLFGTSMVGVLRIPSRLPDSFGSAFMLAVQLFS
ncbi:hypothetical protein R1flu_001741 [Riccia fluitans]|uniref:Uncharacterized protein n=1 Tax=Riccia fluitans TaxID=41844 RepID=A0ABD1Y450_9MARC